MVNIERIINVFDAVCDCLPVISTFTNGAQLLYQLAHKVDKTANPVKTSWTDDIKIHVINKSKFECLIGMVPIFGNLTSLIIYILDGFRDQLKTSILNNNFESTKLYLARHPLNDDQKAKSILGDAAFSSKPEVFEFILNSRAWDIDSMMEALGSCWFPNESREKNANLILDYYDNHLNNSNLNPFQKFTLTRVFKDFIVAGKHEIANRILSITPKCSFGNFEEVLATQSYRSYKNSRSKEGVLNEDQIEAIINRCKPFTLHTLTEYCKKVHKEAESLKYDVDFNNKYDGQNLNKQEIMNGFYEIHYGIIQKLLNFVTDLENSSSIISALSTLANQGEIQLLEMFLVKYENLLLSEDILSILKKTHTFCEKEPALKGFEHLFTKYNHDLTDEQCKELLKLFSDHLLDTRHIIKKMIQIRPDLKELVA